MKNQTFQWKTMNFLYIVLYYQPANTINEIMIQFIPEWTDDEVLEYVGRVIPDYMASLSSGEDFNRDVCVGLQVEELERLYRRKVPRPKSWLNHRRSEDTKVPDHLIAHYRPMIEQQTLEFQMKYKKEHMVRQLNSTAALSVLIPALESAGFQAKVECQQSRIKVIVFNLTPRQGLRFYVSYSALKKKEKIDELIRALRDMQLAASKMGSVFTFINQ